MIVPTLNAIKTLLPAISRNMHAAVLVSVVGVALVVSWRMSPVETPADHFAKALQTDEQVGAELDRVLADTQADRAIIRQFHNGRSSLSGVSFTFATATHARTAPGLSWTAEDVQPVPLDAYNSLLRRMWADPTRPVCSTAGPGEIGAADRRAERGVVVTAYCPVTDLRGNPLGIVVAEYVRRPDVPTGVDARLRDAATRVSGYLLPR